MIMQRVQQFIQDDSALSPVIAVILMVAVTVVLASLVGAFIFGVSDRFSQQAPNTQVAFDYSEENGKVEISHDGGVILTSDNTGTLRITGGDYEGSWGEGYDPDSAEEEQAAVKEDEPDTEIGDTIWYSEEGELQSGDSIELQWTSSDGSNSEQLGSFEVG